MPDLTNGDTFVAIAEGVLIADPRHIGKSKSGVDYSVAHILVRRTNSQNGTEELVNIIAFGQQSDELCKCRKGDVIRVTGPCGAKTWTDKDGKVNCGNCITVKEITRL